MLVFKVKEGVYFIVNTGNYVKTSRPHWNEMIPDTGITNHAIPPQNNDSVVLAQIIFQFTMDYLYYFSRSKSLFFLRAEVHCSYVTGYLQNNTKRKCVLGCFGL